MKSKIIYFVLYLVVIAELLVVIYERDKLVDMLQSQVEVDKYLQELVLVDILPGTKFVPTPRKSSGFNFVMVKGLASEEERENLIFYAQRISPASDLPDKVNSREINNQYVTIKSNKEVGVLEFTSSWAELPGSIRGATTGGGSYDLKYRIHAEGRRKLPGGLTAEGYDKILSQINKIKDKKDWRFYYIFGMSDSLLINVLKVAKDPAIYGIDGGELSSLKSSFEGVENIKDAKKLKELADKYKNIDKIIKLREEFEIVKTKPVEVTLKISYGATN